MRTHIEWLKGILQRCDVMVDASRIVNCIIAHFYRDCDGTVFHQFQEHCLLSTRTEVPSDVVVLVHVRSFAGGLGVTRSVLVEIFLGLLLVLETNDLPQRGKR